MSPRLAIRRAVLRVVPVVVVASMLASCRASAQQDVVMSATDRAIQPTLQEVYRVGKIDGADWEVFGERPEIAFDGAGNLYVFDPTSHRVVVVDPAGRFVRQIGRRGDGPGELRTPMGFVVMRDGRVVVADMGHAAYLVFAPDGTFQHSVSFRGSDGFTVLGALLADPRGNSLLSVGQRAAMVQAGAGARLGSTPPASRSITRVGLSASGGQNPIFTGWSPPPVEAPQPAGGMVVRAPERAFEPGMFAGVLPNGGLVISDSTAYGLKILSPGGQLERTLRRPLRPVAVTPQIQRAERERRLAELASGGGPTIQMSMGAGGGGVQGGGPGVGGPGGAGGAPSASQVEAMRRQQIEQLQFYPEISVVRGLRTGWTGKIWVSRIGSGADPLADGPVDVLTPAGEYLGSIPSGGIRIPQAFGPDGLAAWIERDRFDTPVVVVRRLPAELR